MRGLELKLLSEEPSEIEKSRKELVASAYEFRDEYASRHHELDIRAIYASPISVPKEHQPINNFFRDLVDARFWGSIRFLDGNARYYSDTPLVRYKSEEEASKIREESRKRAAEFFNEYDINRLFNIIVNQALLIPYKTSWPGTYKGHSILHEEIIEKPGSIFKDLIPFDLKKRLNNGRFWEELNDMVIAVNSGNAYYVVNDVLKNYYHDLDANFVKKGFEIFYRNEGRKDNFDLNWLEDIAVERFGLFVNKLDTSAKHQGISEEDLQYLARPYILELMLFNDFKEDDEVKLRFGGTNNCMRKFREGLPQKYMKDSKLIATAVGKELAQHAELDGGNKEEETLRFLEATPEPVEMFGYVVDSMRPRDIAKFAYRCAKKNISLKKVMEPFAAEVSVN